MGEDSAGGRAGARRLLALAAEGGPEAGLAARRAALAAEREGDPALAREALSLAAKLEPLDAAPRLSLARLHAESGDLAAAKAEASAVLNEAVDKAARARAAFMLGEIAQFERDLAGARRFFDQTIRIEDELLRIDRSDPAAARWYARARGRLAELDAAEGQRRQALASAEGALAMLRAAAAHVGESPVLAADIADAEMRLAALELSDKRPASARRRLGEAIARYEALAVTEPDEPHWRAVLSDAWALAAEADHVRGAADAAREAMDKALNARLRLAARYPEEAWALAGVWRLRGALRAALGDADVAAESLTQARALAEQLCGRAGASAAAVRFLVHTLLDQADHALRAGRIDTAYEAADTARAHAERLAHATSGDELWLGECGACWDRLGEVARLTEDDPAALDAFSRAVEFRRMARERDIANPALARRLAAALLKHGEAALDAGAYAMARELFDESVDLRSRLLEASPDDPRAALALAAALERRGLAAAAAEDTAVAQGAWEDELALAPRIFAENDLEGARFRAIVHSHLAGLGGPRAIENKNAALEYFDELARAGALNEREAALRRILWDG